MSKQSKRERRRLRKVVAKTGDLSEFLQLETLRAFVAEEIPSLDSQAPWTREQLKAVASIYLHHQQDPTWRCPHECGRAVARFGEQCPSCRAHQGELGPVDWESIGA